MEPNVIQQCLKEDTLIPLLIFSGVIITVFLNLTASVLKTFAKERSRREIAAFIAEGTMSPEQGERLMKAESKS
ncbi:MAG TPA: hypothetical protein VD997_10825 [Phycisphaerales bacterium]|nr:hypothetical protein [Phycisphaerales bacterium]